MSSIPSSSRRSIAAVSQARAAARRKSRAVRNNPHVLVQRVRRGAARRPPERQGDPRAGGPRGAVHAARRRPACSAIEAASFVHPKLVPQMAGAEEVFAALPDDDGADLRQPRAQPQGPRPRAADVDERDPRRLPGHRHVRAAQPEHDRRGGRARPPRRSSAATRPEGHRDDLGRVRLPVRGPRRPRAGDRARAPDGGGRAPTR